VIVREELESLEALWDTGLEAAYSAYLPAAAVLQEANRDRVAFAAALVEVALRLQRLGGPAASPPDLLRGDLCLARASRLLADARDQHLQISFARAIEATSAAAAAGQTPPPVRDLLLAAIAGGAA